MSDSKKEMELLAAKAAEERDAESNRMSVQTALDLLGVGETLFGVALRPIRMSTIALLMACKSELLSCTDLRQMSNSVLECCRFVVLQSRPLPEARMLALNTARLDEEAMEFADTVPLNELQTVVDTVMRMFKESQDTRTEGFDPKATATLDEAAVSLGE